MGNRRLRRSEEATIRPVEGLQCGVGGYLWKIISMAAQ